MDTRNIIKSLRQEQKRIDKTIRLLEGFNSRGLSLVGAAGRRSYRMSPERRKKLSEAQKKRWAERKKKEKGTSSKEKATSSAD